MELKIINNSKQGEVEPIWSAEIKKLLDGLKTLLVLMHRNTQKNFLIFISFDSVNDKTRVIS